MLLTVFLLSSLSVEELDILPEDKDTRLQDNFESLMTSFGLTERRPIPEPVSLREPDPLGARLVSCQIDSQDIVSSISECHVPHTTRVRLYNEQCNRYCDNFFFI